MEDTAAEVTASDTPQVRQALVPWAPLDTPPAPGLPLRRTACCSWTHEHVQQAGGSGRRKSWAGHSLHGSSVSEQLQQRESRVGQWSAHPHGVGLDLQEPRGVPRPGSCWSAPEKPPEGRTGPRPAPVAVQGVIPIPRKFISVHSSRAPLCLARRSEFTS